MCLSPSANDLSLVLGRDANVRAGCEFVGHETEGSTDGTTNNSNRWVSAGITQPSLSDGILARASTGEAASSHDPVKNAK